jgi:hypothetical protein
MGSCFGEKSQDKAAVAASISAPWSNGRTEGQICKLKLVKRQMYGRGKLDLGRHMSDAVQSLRICIAADESVRLGKPITLV